MHKPGYRIAQLGGVLIVVGGLFDISLREPLPHHVAILAAGSGAAGQESSALVLALLRALGAALVAAGLAILVILWFSRRTQSVHGYAAAATVAILAEGPNAWGIFSTGSAMFVAPLIFMATVVAGAALCIRSSARGTSGGSTKKSRTSYHPMLGHGTRVYHGTRAVLNAGELIEPSSSDRSESVTAGAIYCTADLDAALWEAELAAGEGPGRVYVVEPLGELEDVANEADRMAAGHPSMTLRSHAPLRVMAELTEFPFYHGTRADLKPGDLIEPGHTANFGSSPRSANYVYVSQTLDAATWGAELASGDGPGRIYVVEPTGPIEEDPNLTNQRFRGNPSRSYRSRAPFRVVDEVYEWRGHAPEIVRAMKQSLERLKERGLEPDD